MVMRVLLISTSYPRDASDWRGIFMRYLVGALARQPEIILEVWAPPGELPEHARSVVSVADSQWLTRLMDAGGVSHLMRNGGWQARLAPLRLVRMIGVAYRSNRFVDMYHINWLQCALPLPNDGKPALITVLGNDLKLLSLPLMKFLVRRVLKRRKVAICPNAEWMCEPLRAAFGDLAEVHSISFGVDQRWFDVQRRHEQGQTHCWIAVTRLTADKLGPLFDWSGEFFSDGARELHLFGPMQEDVEVPEWVHYHGSVTPEQLVNEWFPRACGLISLSRHAEGRPQVMLEAMAAGLPIVASNMPAHASIVVDGVTGRLCDSAEEYRMAVGALEDEQTNRRLGQAAKQWVNGEFGTWNDCAERYTRIYRRLLGAS
jgi:hypothetical protein